MIVVVYKITHKNLIIIDFCPIILNLSIAKAHILPRQQNMGFSNFADTFICFRSCGLCLKYSRSRSFVICSGHTRHSGGTCSCCLPCSHR